MQFAKPSKVQERALPLLLRNPPQNLVGQSQSGTGKTAAFTLNILSRLDLSSKQMQTTPQALILAPTRELARQIMGVVKLMGTFVEGLEVQIAVPQDRAQRITNYKNSVIVGTPGTVYEAIKRRQLNPQNLKVLVLDEADNMLDQSGLGDQCSRVRRFVQKPYREPGHRLTSVKYGPSECSDMPIFCNVPATRYTIRGKICTRSKPANPAARGSDR